METIHNAMVTSAITKYHNINLLSPPRNNVISVTPTTSLECYNVTHLLTGFENTQQLLEGEG